MWAMIGTWCMAYEGIVEGSKILNDHGSSRDAIIKAISMVEDYEFYKSVGYGGLPNEDRVVELDAAYMDGDTLSYGGVGALRDFANPIKIAESLSHLKVNNFLVGEGACKYALENGFEEKEMLTKRARSFYNNYKNEEMNPYRGHDTVAMVALDEEGKIVSGTSTSGLFMKKSGRVGDSPIIGSGLYADSYIGGSGATGLGEDLMKGCLSFEVARLMEMGLSPMEACQKGVHILDKELRERRGYVGDLSVIALNNKGEWGVATNTDEFSFVVARDTIEPTVYLVNNKNELKKASQQWLDQYNNERR